MGTTVRFHVGWWVLLSLIFYVILYPILRLLSKSDAADSGRNRFKLSQKTELARFNLIKSSLLRAKSSFFEKKVDLSLIKRV